MDSITTVALYFFPRTNFLSVVSHVTVDLSPLVGFVNVTVFAGVFAASGFSRVHFISLMVVAAAVFENL